jgi:2-polyprenyl-3-methyl-5-hydroxy-6-metoxy-1,4-benzoquinol methylase
MIAPEFTTERFYPDHVAQHGIAALHRHVNRYKWAASLLPPQAVVLDVGCGSGYGDFILLNRAKKVMGIDVAADAVAYAQAKAAKHKEKRLVYAVADVARLGFPTAGGPFDAVVCIEMIEHVDAEAQEKTLAAVANNLKDDGVFIMTTPDKGGTPTTRHHVREMDKNEFGDLLSRHFEQVLFDEPEPHGIPKNFVLAVCRKPRRAQ